MDELPAFLLAQLILPGGHATAGKAEADDPKEVTIGRQLAGMGGTDLIDPLDPRCEIPGAGLQEISDRPLTIALQAMAACAVLPE